MLKVTGAYSPYTYILDVVFGVFVKYLMFLFTCICSCLGLFILYSSFFVGASLNVTDEHFGWSPLHFAARHNLEVAQLLLQKGEFIFLIQFRIVAYIKM